MLTIKNVYGKVRKKLMLMLNWRRFSIRSIMITKKRKNIAIRLYKSIKIISKPVLILQWFIFSLNHTKNLWKTSTLSLNRIQLIKNHSFTLNAIFTEGKSTKNNKSTKKQLRTSNQLLFTAKITQFTLSN